jgi:hypothetical protein
VLLTEARRQAAGLDAPEQAERLPALLLPAWRDPAGQGRDSLGRGTSAEELARVANQDRAALREVEAQKSHLRGAYRDPGAAGDALDALIGKSGNDMRAVARTLREKGPEILGALKGREGWLASRAAEGERARARNAGSAIAGSLEREAAARDAAVRHHTAEVERQRARDAVEVPGLSKAALDALKDVQFALHATELPRDGEGYDARERRREEMIAAAWREGRADPRIAGELDRFMVAAERRLGEEGMRVAFQAAVHEDRMTVPGVGKERQAELDELAKSFVLGRNGTEHSAAWEKRLGSEAREAERERTRQEERQRAGLPPEPPREHQSQTRGLGLSR